MKKIKLFISDIDGVWTDGGMYYDNTGNEFKKFNTSDSAGVAYLRLLNIPLAIISGENNNIAINRLNKLKIKHIFLGIKNKLQIAKKLVAQLGIGLDEVAFIGDDLNDITLLKEVGLSATPENGQPYVKQNVNWIIPVKGGDGAFRAFVEKYLKEQDQLNEAIELYINSLNQHEQ
jgi:YrbI family 3-deoxy-D-manno-octulosonate 8-phosphate phosphatase